MPLSPALSAAAVLLSLAMAGVFVVAAWRPAGTARQRARWALAALAVAALYLGVSGALAASGALADIDARPPPAGLLLLALTAGMAALAFSRFGDRLLAWPMAWLVGFQAFRIAVELWLSALYRAGAVPPEVTYHGHNFDVVTGVLAVALGVWLWRGSPPRWVVGAWNMLGVALLAVVVVTAALSAFGVVPTEPSVLLPLTFPGVWLPSWLVMLAFFGHLLVFRKLRQQV